jgi:hypothetical protein
MKRGNITFLGTVEGDVRYTQGTTQDTDTVDLCVRIDGEVYSLVKGKGKLAFLVNKHDVKHGTKVMVTGEFAPRLAEADVIASEIILVDKMEVLSNV